MELRLNKEIIISNYIPFEINFNSIILKKINIIYSELSNLGKSRLLYYINENYGGIIISNEELKLFFKKNKNIFSDIENYYLIDDFDQNIEYKNIFQNFTKNIPGNIIITTNNPKWFIGLECQFLKLIKNKNNETKIIIEYE